MTTEEKLNELARLVSANTLSISNLQRILSESDLKCKDEFIKLHDESLGRLLKANELIEEK